MIRNLENQMDELRDQVGSGSKNHEQSIKEVCFYCLINIVCWFNHI